MSANSKKIVLALGSNMGNRRENLVAAIAEIAKFAELLAESSIYETEPEGYDNQRDFLNAAIFAETDESPYELLRLCKCIEKKFGREESFRNAPRPIDIDIIFYENAEIKDEILEIPHPRWDKRDFVLSPLYDLLNVPEMSLFPQVRDVLMSRPKKFRPFAAF